MLILKLLIVIAYCIDIHGANQYPYFVSGLTILFFMLSIYDFFDKIPYSNFKKQNFYLILNSIFLITSLIVPFYTLLKILDSFEFLTYALFINPLLVKLIFSFWNKRIDNIMFYEKDLSFFY